MNFSPGGKRQLSPSCQIQSWLTAEHLDKQKMSFLAHSTSGYSLGIEAHQTWSSFLGSTGGLSQILGFTTKCFNVQVRGVSQRFSVAMDQDLQSMSSIDSFCLVVKIYSQLPFCFYLVLMADIIDVCTSLVPREWMICQLGV